MGMDVYGENPKIIGEQPEMPNFDKITEEEKQQYFDAVAKFETDNPGYYFRNNVWWWRPLWDYVCQTCDEFLSQEDKDAGHSNSGYLYDEELADKIANRLKVDLMTGATKSYETNYRRTLSELEQVECVHCEGTGQRDDKYVKGECNGCSGTGKHNDYRTSYPFDVDNVVDFQKFVQASGGFRVC